MPVIIDGTNGVQASAITTTNWTPTNITTGGNTTLGDAAGDTVTINAGTTTVKAGGAVRFEDNAGGEYVAIKAPTTVTTYTLTLPADDGTNGQALITDGSGNLSWSSAASGDVYGPASATNTAVALFDGTTGKLIKNSGVTIDGSNNVGGVAALTASGALTLSSGTANGVAYLNGSKVLTTGSALTYNGVLTSPKYVATSVGNDRILIEPQAAGSGTLLVGTNNAGSAYAPLVLDGGGIRFNSSGSEQMRLTSTGLGIGTSSPSAKLNVKGGRISFNGNNEQYLLFLNNGAAGNGVYLGSSGADTFNISDSNGTERLRLDSSGNLGLGVTPQTGVSGTVPFFQIAQTILSQGQLAVNAYYNGANYIYTTSNYATRYIQIAGQHLWYNAPSGTAGNAINFTQAMTLDASGNLMLGTTTQAGRLHVSVNGVAARFTRTNNTDQYLEITGGDGTGVSTIAAAYQMAFNTAATERMRIDSSGNVGIGTSSPGTKLDITFPYGAATDNGSGQNVIRCYTNAAMGADVGSGIGLGGLYQTGGTERVSFGQIAGKKENATSGNLSGYLQFATLGPGGTMAERMRIDSSGNVGIGTSSPNPQSGVFTPYFTVKGTSYDGVMQVLGSRGDGANTGVGQFNFLQDGNTTYKTVAQITSETEGTTANNRGGRLMFFTKADGATNDTERMRIDSSGKVGIGVSNIAGNLDVAVTGGGTNYFHIGYSTNGDNYFTCGASGIQVFRSGGTERMRIDSSGILLVNTTSYGDSSGRLQLGGDSQTMRFLPRTDNTGYIGQSTYRWAAIYAANGTIQTSDGREKNSVENSSLGLNFVNSLRPVSYKWNVGENVVTYDKDGKEIVTPRAGKRTHFGFIAQEVKNVLGEQDFGGYVEAPDGKLGLRYDQFIAPLVKAIQELKAELDATKAEVAALKGV